MRALLAAARLGAVHRFTYRLEVVVAVVSALAVVAVSTSLWSAAARTAGGVAGMDPAAIGTYAVVAWLVAATAGGRVEEDIGDRFHTGAVASDLCRPVDLQAFVLAREAGRSAASLLLTAVPVFAVMAVFFPMTLPSVPTWGAFAVSVVLAGAVAAQIGFLVGLASFRLRRSVGLAHLKAALVLLFSGAMIPVDALPEGARLVALALPFQAIAHTPASVFLERWTLADLGLQALWAAALLLCCRLAWRGAVRHLTVQGG